MPIHHQPFLGSWLALSLSFISLASSSGSLAATATTAAAKVRRAFEGRIQAKKHVQGLNSWLVDGDVAYSADQVHVGLDVPCIYVTVNRLDSKALAILFSFCTFDSFLPALQICTVELQTHVKTVKLNYSGLLYYGQVFAIHSTTMQKCRWYNKPL